MAAKKRGAEMASSGSKLPRDGRMKLILATVFGSLLNMTVTAVTSGAVLMCLFAAKRFA
jgi:hypothetical protein